jgi:hypothetical protein
MATTLQLFPLNDFAVKAKLKTMDPATGEVGPLLAGTVTGFLATSNGATATAADPSLSVSAVHTGDGIWLVSFDAAALTPTLLDGLFASTPPYLIVQQPGGIRVAAPVTYAASRPATVG